ncbi:MAG: hypothetical protein GWO07_11905, partial [Candidatus Dadabacteria bacterium]|nr:hypothetical protein [Candidatus Dadabacteria bacterium]NIS09443.1 hypothetical protein [Candidatus Dadabacteria bacterium]NIY22681.1 hypothetical protein [Candidatus Dadabacteria bacterium]
DKLFSISDQTKQILGTVQSEVEIIGFFKELGLDRKEFLTLAKQYEEYSDKVRLRMVDPDKSPGLATQYGITEYSTVVVARDQDSLKISLSDPLSDGIINTSEHEITNAIIKLSKDSRKTLYFLIGHGERDTKDVSDVSGFGQLVNAVRDEGYEVSELLVKQNLDLPKYDSILVIAGPRKTLLQTELSAIKNFMDEGGNVIFMLEPQGSAELAALLSQYGIKVGDNIVIDPSSKLVGGGDVAPIVAQYPPHKITNDFKFATLFPFVRTVEPASPEASNIESIAQTSSYSWAETNLALFEQGKADYEPGDRKGPVSVAVVGQLEQGGKIAVFGSVEFSANRFLLFSGNKDYVLNVINWISGDENLITIRPKVAEQGKIVLTDSQLKFFFAVTVILIPLIILTAGIFIWWKRKNM